MSLGLVYRDSDQLYMAMDYQGVQEEEGINSKLLLLQGAPLQGPGQPFPPLYLLFTGHLPPWTNAIRSYAPQHTFDDAIGELERVLNPIFYDKEGKPKQPQDCYGLLCGRGNSEFRIERIDKVTKGPFNRQAVSGNEMLVPIGVPKPETLPSAQRMIKRKMPILSALEAAILATDSPCICGPVHKATLSLRD